MKQKLIIIYILVFITGGLFSITMVYLWNKSYTIYLWKQSIFPDHPKDGFERSTPEAEGIPSTAILDFIEAIEEKGIELHSLMILRHGKIITEGWWKPYSYYERQIMYSVSKIFISTATGFAINENRFSLEDKVISFFPDYETCYNNNPYIQALTVKNLLTMTAGEEPYTDFRLRSNDWIADFLSFSQPIEVTSKFTYNSYASYMLSTIIQRTTGQTLIEYLQPRLFNPLGIWRIKSEYSPAGIICGGWGMSLSTVDMAKIGQLYLQKGNWKGEQLLPESWIEEATQRHIHTDGEQSYGYHIWQSGHNSYKVDGAFGQLMLVMPDQDIVIVITADGPNVQQEIYKYILPSISNKKLAKDKKAHKALTQKLDSLQIPPLSGNAFHPIKNDFSGIYTIENNNDIKEIAIDLTQDVCTLHIRTSLSTHSLPAGNGFWQGKHTDKNSPYYNAHYRNPIGLAPFTVAGSFHWTATNQIIIKYLFIEDLSNETYKITFEKNRVTITITENSEDPQKGPLTLTGIRKTIN